MHKNFINVLLICLIGILLMLSGCGMIEQKNATVAVADMIEADSYHGVELTDQEKVVDEKLSELRNELLEEYDGNPYAMKLLSDETLTTSDLYQFCVDIPKGGDLHVHAQALLDFDTMLNLALEKNAYVVMDEGEDFCKIGTLNDKPVDYECEYIQLKEAMDSNRLDVDTIKHFWTMRDYLDSENPWAVFTSLREYTQAFYGSEEAEYDYYRTAFNMYLDYGVQVIELRDPPVSELVTNEEYQVLYHHLETVRQAYYDVKKEHPELVVRVILAPSHRMPKKDSKFIGHVLEKSILLYDEFMDETMEGEEHFISGFDLVGEEDDCFPLREYEELFATTEIPEGFKFYFHCGESNRVDNVNVFDAYRFGSVRVGHGYNLYRYPNLLEKYKEAGITLEICPISNMQLSYVRDLRAHPAVAYLKRGLNMIISSDDPQFMENKTLVDDYFATIVCWNLNLAQIKLLSKNAILSSSLTGDALEQALKNWQSEWDEWIASIS